MNESRFREFCLALPQAFESFPFGDETSVFKTSGNGKIFALGSLDRDPLTVSVKCDPEDALALREEFTGIIPGYHLNKKHWITIDASAVPADLVEQLVTDSHRLVRPRTARSNSTGFAASNGDRHDQQNPKPSTGGPSTSGT